MLHKFPQVADYAAEGGEGISLFRISPDAISLLDYRKGFGHTEYVRNSPDLRAAAAAGSAAERSTVGRFGHLMGCS